MVHRAVFALVVALAVTVTSGPVVAQEGGSTTTSTTIVVGPPTRDIVPAPNEGTPPSEAGDRGGALQLGLLALVLAAIAGAVLGVVRQSRRARGLDGSDHSGS